MLIRFVADNENVNNHDDEMRRENGGKLIQKKPMLKNEGKF